ncbi:hypothetical protein PUW24_07215 [Paenibacillus urinalis]|uniref:Uncharacterized protein n=1 Tax=Paenibacillus urinalis TaxID=521520 RepID=A0ABY7X9A5_9BACL|nr:hypothetical protein [Paenibacillus urinalis]WDH98700.1 hypothetical protein PUW24_07215 [Paenibacillus urinalis]WDI02393.1 hypothetical protein PUW25_24935 [Paenibacillus urinalis]
MKETFDHTDPSHHFELFIDILADMICHYLKAEDVSTGADKLSTQSSQEAA